MIAVKLAWRNLLGAGLRTVLNVSVLSFAYVLIVFYNGMMDGWQRESRRDTIHWETGQGQWWHPSLDMLNPLTYQDAHAPLSDQVRALVAAGRLTPVLLVPATAYPEGRMESILLRGIDPNQRMLDLPTSSLAGSSGNPCLLGRRMAQAMKLDVGDALLVRWRDGHGTFDAREFTVVALFDCHVPSVDQHQVWLPIDSLRSLTGLPGEATYLVAGKDGPSEALDGWVWKDLSFLLSDIDAMVKAKKSGGFVLQFLLLFIALLALFDTQVLSIFRRQKEIGTYVALGMTRWQVVGIFTVEGAAYSIVAALLGAAWGIPLLLFVGKTGLRFGMDDMGITMGSVLYPYYSLPLIGGTLIVVILTATLVSFLPARKIARMKPTDALKGKLQ